MFYVIQIILSKIYVIKRGLGRSVPSAPSYKRKFYLIKYVINNMNKYYRR